MFKIEIKPSLSIEEQLHAKAWKGKCAMVYWDDEEHFNSWLSGDLTYQDKLYIIDSLQRRLTWEIEDGGIG